MRLFLAGLLVLAAAAGLDGAAAGLWVQHLAQPPAVVVTVQPNVLEQHYPAWE